ncbi:MAG: hypothetical protein EA412_04650 [Chitinophagaceae bacterium]|nr:MAG: hypothetical protein EA412_04650 [Chitinophagaceae bacterium]
MKKNRNQFLEELFNTLSKQEKRWISHKIKEAKTEDTKFVNYYFDSFLKNSKTNVNFNEKQIHNYRNKIYSFAIDELLIYNRKSDYLDHLRSEISKARLLYQKSLLSQAEVILLKTLKKARLNEWFIQEYEILVLLESILIKKGENSGKFINSEEFMMRLNELEKDKLAAIEKCKSEAELETLKNKIFVQIRIDRFSNNNRLKEEFPNISILEKEQYPRTKESFRLNLIYHSILGIYLISIGKEEESISHFKKILDIFDENEVLFELMKPTHEIYLYNYILNAHRIKKYDDYFHLKMEYLKALSDEKPEMKVSFHCMNLIWKSTIVDVNGLQNAIKEATLDYKNKKFEFPGIYLEMDFYFDLCTSNLLINNMEEALNWLNQILNHDNCKKVMDLYSIARIMQIILHYEMGNVIYLQSLIPSVQKSFQKRDKVYEVEKLMATYILKIVKSKTKQQNSMFKDLHDKLKILENSESESQIMNYFNFTDWTESKISGLSFLETVKKQTNN